MRACACMRVPIHPCTHPTPTPFGGISPHLVLRQVPVEDVELQLRHEVQDALQKGHWVEVAADVEEDAAPAPRGAVADLWVGFWEVRGGVGGSCGRVWAD